MNDYLFKRMFANERSIEQALSSLRHIRITMIQSAMKKLDSHVAIGPEEYWRLEDVKSYVDSAMVASQMSLIVEKYGNEEIEKPRNSAKE